MAQAQLEVLPSYFEQYKNSFLFVFYTGTDYSKFLLTREHAIAEDSGDFCCHPVFVSYFTLMNWDVQRYSKCYSRMIFAIRM